MIDLCKDGEEHTWGIDGMHSNEFCKKCFTNKPDDDSIHVDLVVMRAYEEIDNFGAETVTEKAIFINKTCDKYKISKADLIEYELHLIATGGRKHA